MLRAELPKRDEEYLGKRISEYLVDELSSEEQRIAAERELPAIIEVLSDKMSRIKSFKSFDHTEIRDAFILILEALMAMGKYLVVTHYKMDIFEDTVKSLLARTVNIEEENEEEDKTEVNKLDHQSYI